MKNSQSRSTRSGPSSPPSWRQLAERDAPRKIDEVDLHHLQKLQQRFEQETASRQGPRDSDLEEFAREHLRIRTKQGAILPLAFNRAQRYIHAQLEAQKAA